MEKIHKGRQAEICSVKLRKKKQRCRDNSRHSPSNEPIISPEAKVLLFIPLKTNRPQTGRENERERERQPRGKTAVLKYEISSYLKTENILKEY